MGKEYNILDRCPSNSSVLCVGCLTWAVCAMFQVLAPFGLQIKHLWGSAFEFFIPRRAVFIFCCTSAAVMIALRAQFPLSISSGRPSYLRLAFWHTFGKK